VANRLEGKVAVVTGGDQAFVKHRMQTKSGDKVINISFVHEELPFPHFASYCASKGGIKMLTRNLSIELAPLGITINSIAPGAIETAIKQETAERSSETEIAAGKHSAKAPRQTGRCGIGGRVSGISGRRLRDGNNLFRRRWLDMEPRGAVRSVLENAI
jgi:NAD(P)-dependent dehydrogenase (short-subunit alcohol dehydrogenase family)